MHLEMPDTAVVRETAERFSRKAVVQARRFPAGLCHFVFEMTYDDGSQNVIRIARLGNEKALGGAVYWESYLRALGIPIARILHADLERQIFHFGYLVIERLDGSDLGEVYPRLSRQQKAALAERIAEIQVTALTLPACTRFGDALSYEAPGQYTSWLAVMEANIARCRQSLKPDSLLNSGDVARLEGAASSCSSSLSLIKPLPFLDDITSNNVIVCTNGALSGIVDVDTLCFGDSLFTLALTRAAFAKLGFDAIYTDAWESLLQLNSSSVAHLHLYTALFAAILLSEQGGSYNRNSAMNIDDAAIVRLRQLFEHELRLIS